MSPRAKAKNRRSTRCVAVTLTCVNCGWSRCAQPSITADRTKSKVKMRIRVPPNIVLSRSACTGACTVDFHFSLCFQWCHESRLPHFCKGLCAGQNPQGAAQPRSFQPSVLGAEVSHPHLTPALSPPSALHKSRSAAVSSSTSRSISGQTNVAAAGLRPSRAPFGGGGGGGGG